METVLDSGVNTTESFANFDPLTSSWKMSPPCATKDAALTSCSVTWPRAGMMQLGIASAQPPSAPLTRGSGFSYWHGSKDANPKVTALWPTPNASDAQMVYDRNYSKRTLLLNLERGHQANLWNLLKLADIGAPAFPSIYCWMMGFPAKWGKTSGVTNEVTDKDLVHGFGNAVVPQVAEHVGKILLNLHSYRTQ